MLNLRFVRVMILPVIGTAADPHSDTTTRHSAISAILKKSSE